MCLLPLSTELTQWTPPYLVVGLDDDRQLVRVHQPDLPLPLRSTTRPRPRPPCSPSPSPSRRPLLLLLLLLLWRVVQRRAKDEIDRHRRGVEPGARGVDQAEVGELPQQRALRGREGRGGVREPDAAVGELEEEGEDLVAGIGLVRDAVLHEAPDLQVGGGGVGVVVVAGKGGRSI